MLKMLFTFVILSNLALAAPVQAQATDFKSDWELIKSRLVVLKDTVATPLNKAAGLIDETAGAAIQLPGMAVSAYDHSTSGTKAVVGLGSLVSGFLIEGNSGTVRGPHTIGRKIGVLVVIAGGVILIDSALQAILNKDRSYLFSAIETFVLALTDTNTVAPGTLTAYYGSKAGFDKYLQLDEESAEFYAGLDRKLDSRVRNLANFVRTAEASGTRVAIGIAVTKI